MRFSWIENAYIAYPYSLRRAILTRKLGQTDLVFAVLSGFVSDSMYSRLQVSACSGYDLCHIHNRQMSTHTHAHTSTQRQHFDQFVRKLIYAQPAELQNRKTITPKPLLSVPTNYSGIRSLVPVIHRMSDTRFMTEAQTDPLELAVSPRRS